jgi:PTH1 family peptidyl-tRNA hydrolase
LEQDASQIRLVVGLGNPGAEYNGTRHNVGFAVVDLLAKEWGLAWQHTKSWHALWAKGEKAILVKPTSYMNRSGEPLQAVANFYKIAPAEILVVLDDMALELGRLRLRPDGGTGGHNGLESIIVQLGTEEIPRLRVGIGAAGDGEASVSDMAENLASVRSFDQSITAPRTDREKEEISEALGDGMLLQLVQLLDALGDDLAAMEWFYVEVMGLRNAVLALPIVVVIMSATLQGFDQRLEQAAFNLGLPFTSFGRQGVAHDVQTTSPLSTGDWHQIAATVDASFNVVLYIDGRAAASGTTTSTAPAAPLQFSHSTYLITGQTDHVNIWNRALLPSEVASLFRDPFSIYVRSARPMSQRRKEIIRITAAATTRRNRRLLLGVGS